MSREVNILVVEDDEALLIGLTDLLEDVISTYDVTVTTASNGLEALRTLEKHVPDLILSDVNMPVMDGFEFLARVRENPDWVHIPFIFLTARGSQQDVYQGRLSGAQLYLTKPFVSQDVIALVQSQLERAEQLAQARANTLAGLKGRILQILNHEFRTPLTYVTAYYEMLLDGLNYLEDPALLQEYLNGIRQGSERLNRLVDQLIMVVGLRTGEMAAEYQRQAGPIPDLAQIVRRVVGDFKPQAELHQIALALHTPREPVPVWGVPRLLNTAIYQLVDNALKFTAYRKDGKGSVRVMLETEGETVRLQVVDNGPGFPPEVSERLFDEFYQHDRDRMEQQGAGTGLTIVKGVAELHQGRVTASGKVGEGATFVWEMPAFSATTITDHPPASLPQAHPTPPARPLANVLIVEDDPYLLSGLDDLLELFDTQYEIHTRSARNGLEALAHLEAGFKPDLIISDIMMPEMDGYALLEKVRSQPQWVEIPFIFLTARATPQDIHQGRRKGAEEYIVKPYEGQELLALVETQLTRRFVVQQSTARDFAAFKRSILALLQPDLQAPLQSVSSYAGQLTSEIERVANEQELRASLQGLQQANAQLVKVIDDFMSLAELRSGEAENAYRYRATRVEALETFWLDILQRLALEDPMGEMTFDTSALKPLPPIFGDPFALQKAIERLMRVIVLLIHEQDAPRLVLSSEATPDQIFIHVRLPGLRMADERAAWMQRLLHEADDQAISLSHEGAALAVAGGLIDLHKGTVQIDNEGEQGWTFTIMLPRETT